MIEAADAISHAGSRKRPEMIPLYSRRFCQYATSSEIRNFEICQDLGSQGKKEENARRALKGKCRCMKTTEVKTDNIKTNYSVCTVSCGEVRPNGGCLKTW
jgi:hypothetical protein